MRKIIIQNYKLPSRNELYSQGHWSVRQKLAKEVHQMVTSHIEKPYKIYKNPVNIRIDAYYKYKRRRDSDNIEAKLVIDALKEKVIQDDDPRYVHDVTTRSHIGSDLDTVVISIEEDI